MYDSFDMACHDENTDLRLNIRVNSENLLPTQQKYNLGSLRLPADPSWPKIPQRRLADDTGDLIQPPCTVTLTGTPRRSRTIVRTPQSQSFKHRTTKDTENLMSHHYSQKIQNPHSQQSRRKSGCTDPRFKKVTTVKSQMTSTDPGEHVINKQAESTCSTLTASNIPWKDMYRAEAVLQEAEKPGEIKRTESIGTQTMLPTSAEIIFDLKPITLNAVAESNMEKSEPAEFRRKSCSPVKSPRKQYVVKTPRPNTTPQNNDLGCSKSNEPNYGCQYKNVPVGMSEQSQSTVDVTPHLPGSLISSSPSKNLLNNIGIPQLELPDNVTPQLSNVTVGFPNILGKPFSSLDMDKLNFQLKIDATGQPVEGSQKNHNPDSKSEGHAQLQKNTQYQSLEICNNNSNSNRYGISCEYLSNKSNIPNSRLQFESSPEKLMKNIHNEEKCRPQQKFTNSCKNCVPRHEFHIYCHQDKLLQSHSTEIPQKLSEIQSPRYHMITRFDSEWGKHGNSIDPKQNSKKESYVCAQRKIADSGSHVSDNMDEESTKFLESESKPKSHSNLSPRLNATFFDGIDDHNNKEDQLTNHTTMYFERKHPSSWTLDPKHNAKLTHEQGRAVSFRQKRKLKSDQHLMLNKQRVQSSEPHIRNSRRRSRTPYLKRASSYLSKCYNHDVKSESQTTFANRQQLLRSVVPCPRQNANNLASTNNIDVLQSMQHNMKATNINSTKSEDIRIQTISHPTDIDYVKREHCMKPYQRPSHKSKITPLLDLEKQNDSPQKSITEETEVATENATTIPIKTQQLLNKSYWEYYKRLKLHKMENGESPQQQYFCQVAMGAPQSKKRKAPEHIIEESNNTSQIGDQMELSLPEIRTLEQCSVLSTMINNAFTKDSVSQPSTDTIQQIYRNVHIRSSSDPTAGTQSAILKKLFPGENGDSKVSSTLVKKLKHKRDKQLDNKAFRLRSISEHPVVFFGCMVYAMIVFIPMIYDYFFYEEHEEYEELSYVEIAFEYIIASFKEAFGEFFQMANKIFFKPRSCKKCSNHT